MPDAEDRREAADLGLGYPSATPADEELPRCDACGGYYDNEGRCHGCRLTAGEAAGELEGSRYAVTVVYPDGNPSVSCRTRTLLAALRIEHGLYESIHGRKFVGVADTADEERGWLTDLSYLPDRDAGPDPQEAW